VDSCQGWIHVRDGFMSGMDSCQGWIHVSDGFMPERSCSCIPFSIPRRRRRPGAGDRVQAIGCRRPGAGDRLIGCHWRIHWIHVWHSLRALNGSDLHARRSRTAQKKRITSHQYIRVTSSIYRWPPRHRPELCVLADSQTVPRTRHGSSG